eukprot:scaffold7592_cov89-Cylindrotheca_fusiformis.AAC.1
MQLLETLVGPHCDHLWSRSIALYLDRDPTHYVLSDASYLGLGGWSPDFLFLWRLTRDDLVSLGFRMKKISHQSGEPATVDAPGLHINPLEFIATIINLWLALKCIQVEGPRVGGHVLGLLSDNTSALSWMSYTSRTRDPLLQGLARIASSLLVRATALLTKVLPSHIPGQDNDEADMLSRPWEALPHRGGQKGIPSLASVIARCSRLQPCRICLLPSKLLQILASKTSSLRIEGTLEQTTTELLMLEPRFLPTGVPPGDLTMLAGNNLKQSHDLSSQTVSNYLVSAKAVLQTLASRSIDIYDASSMSRQPRYHPLLGQLLSERRKWTKPLPQKEPFTTEMFQWMLQSLQQEPLPLVAFVGRRFCVYDWMRLGIFTGFRVSEYGQSQLRAGQRFQRVPDSADVPP